jgi:hypothetical protein
LRDDESPVEFILEFMTRKSSLFAHKGFTYAQIWGVEETELRGTICSSVRGVVMSTVTATAIFHGHGSATIVPKTLDRDARWIVRPDGESYGICTVSQVAEQEENDNAR